MKRCLLALLPLLISGPVAAAEVELWQGLWSGMTKAQVEQRLNQKFTICRPFKQHLTCDTKPYLNLGGYPFMVRTDFINGKLDSVILNYTRKTGCWSTFDSSGKPRLPPFPGSEESKKADSCSSIYKERVASLFNETQSALTGKYGKPDAYEPSLRGPIWNLRGKKILLFYVASYEEVWMVIRYEKSQIFNSI